MTTNSSLVDNIYNEMIENISSGKWPSGYKIPTEYELTQHFNASRTSIRQAVAKLRALGLVEATRGSGTYVKENGRASAALSNIVPTIMFDVRDGIQIFEFHTSIQIECAKLAAARYTPEQLRQMRAECAEMEKAYAEGRVGQAIFHDLNMHKLVCEMTGNIMFVRATEIIYQRLSQSFSDIASSFDYNESLIFHRRLIVALESRDPLYAASIMEAHQRDTYYKDQQIARKA